MRYSIRGIVTHVPAGPASEVTVVSNVYTSTSEKKTALIIGAGPAGLTAAYELLESSDIKPIIYEATPYVGGISRTHEYKGNRLDIGGHRFFSKSERVVDWWFNILPLEKIDPADYANTTSGYSKYFSINGPDPETADKVMLLRRRLSRIYHGKKFFNYPISLNKNTLRNLGLIKTLKVGFCYLEARLFPRKEKSLEDFMINRFGKELYQTFFKDYSEKLWGVSPSEIPPDWGAQRVKGVSISKVIRHALKKSDEASLIDEFLYPKLGPGHLWETVADTIKARGGEIRLFTEVTGMTLSETAGAKKIATVVLRDAQGRTFTVSADYIISSMPVKDLIEGMQNGVPVSVRETASGLTYRDFVTVGVLINKSGLTENNIWLSDNWIYTQDPEVKKMRIQIFNNWSRFMVKNPRDTLWLGLEYCCNEGDELWRLSDQAMIDFAKNELEKSLVIDPGSVIDACVVRVPKAYPSYFGHYKNFHLIKDFVDGISNLYLIGRNGMHRYNNQDHSMLTAIKAVEVITGKNISKEEIWKVNTESEYHEKRSN